MTGLLFRTVKRRWHQSCLESKRHTPLRGPFCLDSVGMFTANSFRCSTNFVYVAKYWQGKSSIPKWSFPRASLSWDPHFLLAGSQAQGCEFWNYSSCKFFQRLDCDLSDLKNTHLKPPLLLKMVHRQWLASWFFHGFDVPLADLGRKPVPNSGRRQETSETYVVLSCNFR